MNLKLLIHLLLLMGCTSHVYGFQTNYLNDTILIRKTNNPLDSFPHPYLKKYLEKLYSYGYYQPHIYIYYKPDSQYTRIIVGKKIKIESVENDTSLMQIPSIHSNSNNISTLQLNNYINSWLNYFENHGYPFALFYTTPVRINDSVFHVKLSVTLGKYIQYDTLDFLESGIINKNFLYTFLNIHPGKPYNESQVKKINLLLSSLSFIEIISPAEIFFNGNKALIRLNIKKKQTGNLDAVLGLAPSSSLNKSKFLLTGEAHFQKFNILKRGISLQADYLASRISSRELFLQLKTPVLGNVPIGAGIHLNIFKFDSLFLDVRSGIIIDWKGKPGSLFQLSAQNKTISLLQFDTFTALQTKQLPEVSDISIQLYGITYKYSKLSHPLFPVSGWEINCEINAGKRKINEIDILKKAGLYNKITTQSAQSQYNFFARIYKNWGENWVWYNQIQAAGIYAPQLFLNDLYRIGGLRTLRGFDEQSILASSYATLLTEIRYLTSKKTYALLFAGTGWFENKGTTSYIYKYPVFGGTGVNLNVKSGLFSLYYAFGTFTGNPFLFSTGKIHFGFINSF